MVGDGVAVKGRTQGAGIKRQQRNRQQAQQDALPPQRQAHGLRPAPARAYDGGHVGDKEQRQNCRRPAERSGVPEVEREQQKGNKLERAQAQRRREQPILRPIRDTHAQQAKQAAA